MSIVVGFGPDGHGVAGAHLANELASATGQSLVVCCVVQYPWETPAREPDADWYQQLQALGSAAIERVRAELPEGARLEPVVLSGRSVPRVLLEEARRRDAAVMVVGSSTVGALGRIALGGVSDRLVHSADLPIALAPRGYRATGDLRRLVLAAEPTVRTRSIVPALAPLAESLGAAVALVTFAVHRTLGPAPPAAVGSRLDDVYTDWRRRVEETHKAIEDELTEAGLAVQDSTVCEAARWSSAVRSYDWQNGDVLVVGSSEHGPVAQVFLGSTAARIVRHVPVPVVVVPRS